MNAQTGTYTVTVTSSQFGSTSKDRHYSDAVADIIHWTDHDRTTARAILDDVWNAEETAIGQCEIKCAHPSLTLTITRA